MMYHRLPSLHPTKKETHFMTTRNKTNVLTSPRAAIALSTCKLFMCRKSFVKLMTKLVIGSPEMPRQSAFFPRLRNYPFSQDFSPEESGETKHSYFRLRGSFSVQTKTHLLHFSRDKHIT